MMAQAGKRHGMIKRTNSQIRKLRGTTTLSKQDGKIVKVVYALQFKRVKWLRVKRGVAG